MRRVFSGSSVWRMVSLSLAILPCIVGILFSLAMFLVSLLFSEWMASSNAFSMWVVILFIPWSFSAIAGASYLVSEKLKEPIRTTILVLPFLLSFQMVVHYFEYLELVNGWLKFLHGAV